jgi:hypothetical protein
MTTTPVLGCGTYILNLQCPECQQIQEVAIFLDTRLTVDQGGSRLAAKLNGKPVDHICGQLRLSATVTPPLFGDDAQEIISDPQT